MKRILQPILLLFFLLASCAPAPTPRPSDPWTAADLRILDPAGDAYTVPTDILAIYTRTTTADVEIRIDLLDINFDDFYIVSIELFDEGQFAQLPLVIKIYSPNGSTTARQASDLPYQARVVRDPWLDTILVRINRTFISGNYTVHVVSLAFEPGYDASDTTLFASSDAAPPTASAPLLLAFTDTFPAASPAQALRRWDGAHTGPNGGRHGLRHLLEAARRNGVPLALLDLQDPVSLAVLDSFGGLDMIREMTDAGLLILPEVAWAEPAEAALEASRRAVETFDLPASPFAYRASGSLLEDARSQFVALDDPAHLSRSDRTRLIPLHAGDGFEATDDGPTLAVRRALMDAALSDDPADMVVLGGDLPRSTWGDAEAAAATLAWIAAHPWIRPLDADALLDFPVGGETQPAAPAAVEPLPFLDALQAAPDNALTATAWQVYLTLAAPTSDPDLLALRRVYAGQVGVLLAGSAWAEEPTTAADCSLDLDGDGRPECRLANDSYLAVIKTNGARLTHLFFLDEAGPHQLVGPTAQFQIGIGDPSLWDLSAGDAADPGQVMGAFSDADRPFEDYFEAYARFLSPQIVCLELETIDRTRVKTFCLDEGGLTIHYESSSAALIHTSVPLVVDPWAFLEGQAYGSALSPSGWRWGPENGIRAEVRAEADFRAQGFTVSAIFLARPEDPDFDYPFGHYLPYPLSLLEIDSAAPFSVRISAESDPR